MTSHPATFIPEKDTKQNKRNSESLAHPAPLPQTVPASKGRVSQRSTKAHGTTSNVLRGCCFKSLLHHLDIAIACEVVQGSA